MIDVISMVDHPDGTCTVCLSLGQDEFMAFAKIGILHVVEKASANVSNGYEVVGGHFDSEGSGDDQTGEGGDSPLP